MSAAASTCRWVLLQVPICLGKVVNCNGCSAGVSRWALLRFCNVFVHRLCMLHVHCAFTRLLVVGSIRLALRRRRTRSPTSLRANSRDHFSLSAMCLLLRRRRTRSRTSLRARSTWCPTSTPPLTSCASRGARVGQGFLLVTLPPSGIGRGARSCALRGAQVRSWLSSIVARLCLPAAIEHRACSCACQAAALGQLQAADWTGAQALNAPPFATVILPAAGGLTMGAVINMRPGEAAKRFVDIDQNGNSVAWPLCGATALPHPSAMCTAWAKRYPWFTLPSHTAPYHADLFHAAILGVPFVDCLTTMLDETVGRKGRAEPQWSVCCARGSLSAVSTQMAGVAPGRR